MQIRVTFNVENSVLMAQDSSYCRIKRAKNQVQELLAYRTI